MSGRQLELFGKGTSEETAEPTKPAGPIEDYLTSKCSSPVVVVFTDNSSTMIHVRRKSGYTVRLHRMFAEAPEGVLSALAVYMKWPKHGASNAKLSSFIKEHSHLVRTRTRQPGIKTQGQVYDLREIYDNLNKEYFDGCVKKPITWGRAFKGRRKRSIRFGCVDHNDGLIRINPALDAGFVPDYFIEYIVYHEMLHCLVDSRRSANGRNMPHHGGFREREKKFKRYGEALDWQKKNLCRFLGRKRRR